MKYEVESHKTKREVYEVEASSPDEAIKLVVEGKGNPLVGEETQSAIRAERAKPRTATGVAESAGTES